MKRVSALLAALVLALGLTACANTATTTDTMPRGRNMYDRYTTDTYHGNVSTTDDGWVNGTNEPTQKPKKETTTTRTKRTTTTNTDAMGAGMKG